MNSSTAGVTASAGFICILTVACNEVTLLKCSCDPEGLQSLLQHDVRYLELQEITGRRSQGLTLQPPWLSDQVVSSAALPELSEQLRMSWSDNSQVKRRHLLPPPSLATQTKS